MNCLNCMNVMTAADQAVDPYVKICLACWAQWEQEAGAPLARYGIDGAVCAACGMGFGGTVGFDRHRRDGQCLSPAKLKAQNRPLALKNGIWVGAYRVNTVFSHGERPTRHATKKVRVG